MSKVVASKDIVCLIDILDLIFKLGIKSASHEYMTNTNPQRSISTEYLREFLDRLRK